ncbi:PREDICTED: N-acetylserotonin O-methyltransferase-like protein [Chinchilla lanigera]|uniref:N-acetylserotonin O-methyltransferase-like protein n=1 Tax=Chinchilla lanigera TaxID=34839 RepID=UPI000696FE26|nr:PREDICTED: N-acetylserotonin O-methyltransferase-like protein [Chinchilla lanigera]
MALSPVLGQLLHKRVVLASASPRRREILSNAGLRFEVVPSRFRETLRKSSFCSPYAYAVETAKQKALEVAARLHQKDLRTPDVVIGADTIVALEGLILEKPADKQDAYRMLSRLSGKEHSVFTGVCIVQCGSREGQLQTHVLEFYEETRVRFSELSEEMLWEYIHSGEPMDKAGGYGIQALGGMLVEAVHGDFLNVVGFPLNRFCKELAQLYRPPGPRGVGRLAKHDSIPCVDSLEDLGDDPGTRHGDTGPERSTDANQGPPCSAAGQRLSLAESDPAPREPKGASRMGPRDTRPSSAAGLLRLIHSFKAAQALRAACQLKVFDLLQGGATRTAADLAGQLGASVCGTRRLLESCVGLGLLHRAQRGYRNTELAGVYLVSDGEVSLNSYILHTGAHAWDRFIRVGCSTEDGQSQQHAAAGTKPRDPVQEEQVLRAAHGIAQLTAHAVATAVDLSRFGSACHLGGCTGALAHELAREYPGLTVTVLDLPDVIERAHWFRPRGPEAAQVSFAPGDILRDGLPAAQLYVLAPLPRAWPGTALRGLLRRVASACRPGCGLLLADAFAEEEQAEEEMEVDEEEADRARGGLARVLDQLVLPEAGACSVDTCRRWLEQLGFRDLHVAPVGDTRTLNLTVLLATWAGP